MFGLLLIYYASGISYLDFNAVNLLFIYTKKDHYVGAFLHNTTMYLPKTVLYFSAKYQSICERNVSLLLPSIITMIYFIIPLYRLLFPFTVNFF